MAAMDGEIVRKVTCSICGGNHLYKSKKPEPKTRSATKTTAAGKTRRTRQAAFTIDPNSKVRSYNINTSFAAGDVISHPKFGLGAVEIALPPNKIEVRFQEGKKLLLHNMKNIRP